MSPSHPFITTPLLIMLGVLLAAAAALLVWLVLRLRRRAAQRRVQAGKARIAVNVVYRIGARKSQQDNYAVTEVKAGRPTRPGGTMAVVADGMGGLTHGEEVSALAVATFLDSFKAEKDPASPDHLLMEYLKAANEAVNQFVEKADSGQAGTTLVAAIIHEGLLHFVSVGDSRIYLWRAGGLVQLNREHSYGAQLDQLAMQSSVNFGEAASDLYRNAITSYLGMGRLQQIDKPVRPIPLQRGDKVLLASDGIFTSLDERQLAPMLAGYAEQAAYTIEQVIESNAHPRQDNYTAVIIAYGT